MEHSSVASGSWRRLPMWLGALRSGSNELDAYFAPEDLQAAANRMLDCTFVLRPGLPHASLDPDVRSDGGCSELSL